ncbi:hypothetical protein RGUI_1116 [Rhodovulum sp. P5]|nr:hypothetical protein RGUI_1116 [Rhodovulum sp. P5]
MARDGQFICHKAIIIVNKGVGIRGGVRGRWRQYHVFVR